MPIMSAAGLRRNKRPSGLCLAYCLMAWAAASCTASLPVSPPNTASIWQDFQDPNTASKPLIDFSYAGAHYSQAAYRKPSQDVFHVKDYGAVADDNQDDTQAIQRAVNAASENRGGVVAFGSGVYDLNSGPDARPIRIASSNISLRGSGDLDTVLFMKNPMPPENPFQKWSGPAMILFQPLGTSAPSSKAWPLSGQRVTEPVPMGSFHVNLDDASGLRAGDYIEISLQNRRAVLAYFGDKNIPENWEALNEHGVRIRELHEISAVNGNELALKAPLLTGLDTAHPWRVRPVKLIENVGFENLYFRGNFTQEFEHHKNALHNSGYRAVEFTGTAHSWAANNRFENVSTAITLRGGLANSVMLNSVQGHGGHFSFHAEFSTRSLLGLNLDRTDKGQFHGAGMSHFSSGTVVWKFKNVNGGGFDAHGTFPRQSLLDNISAAKFSTWGGHYKDLPNHGDGLVIWNYDHSGPEVGNHYRGTLDFWQLPEADKKYGFLTAIDPMLIGYRGVIKNVNADNLSRLEALGTHVSPPSLFEAQLENRLGERPDWMEAALLQWNAMQSPVQP